jgi:hypothetical protein
MRFTAFDPPPPAPMTLITVGLISLCCMTSISM